MFIPKIPCTCGCTQWALTDYGHECKRCEREISKEEMLTKLSSMMDQVEIGGVKNAG